MINFYRDMWQKRSELLAPLTALTYKNVKYEWTDEHQKCFEAIKRVSPDIFQKKMSELFVGLDTVRVYIDDLLHVTKGSWTEHLSILEKNVHPPPEGWAQSQRQQILLWRT